MNKPCDGADRRRDGRARIRLLVGCVIGLATGFAGLFIGTLTIFLKPIATEFGWSRTDTAAGVVMAMLGLAIGSPIQGRLIDRLGARVVIGCSTIALGMLLVTLSMIPADHMLFALCALAIGTFGVATGPNGYLSLIPRWFGGRLGLALATAMIGVGLGAALIAPLSQMAVVAGGWRHAYRLLALVSLLGGGLAFLLVDVGSPSPTWPLVDGGQPSSTGATFGEALRDRRFRLLALALLLSSAGGLGMTFHTAPMLDDRGFTPGQIAMTVSLSGIGLMSGRLAGGALLDFLPARIVGAGTYLIGALAVALLGLDRSGDFLPAASGGLLLGFALGTEGDFMAFVVRRYFGLRAFAGIYGCIFAAYSVGSVAGVILYGRAYDRFHDYDLASAVSVGCFLIAMLLVLMLGPYRYAHEGRRMAGQS